MAIETPLTERQLEILALVASGNTIDEAAQVCFISKQTAYNILSLARTRANAASKTHLVVIALQRGWLEVDDNGTVTVAASLQTA